MYLSNYTMFVFFCLAVFFYRCDNHEYSLEGNRLPEIIDFNYHVKPILSDRCFSCHGPDKNTMKADLRLDTEDGLLKKVLKSGGHAFAPGSVAKSHAFSRMLSKDPELKMPPPESKLSALSPYEIAIIAKWIEQGAEYKPHWSFIPVEKPEIPVVKNLQWIKNQIDHFVLNKLEREGISPGKEAEKEILLRRVTLDFTGLPPSMEEIDAFLKDEDEGAWERVVDRLLASPRYGERMALDWLDIARYADSHGYSQDGLRIMWPWRDWVIKAYNENMPYDQFITWQLAGDKLPDATDEQRLATAFLRNQRLNSEGGIIQDEYLVEYAADRTETFGTAFLGMTMQCARCHEHKNDPITQEEYYRLFSFFNHVNETGLVQKDGNSGPQILLASKKTEKKISGLEKEIEKLEGKIDSLFQESTFTEALETSFHLKKGLIVDLNFDATDGNRYRNDAVKGEYINFYNDLIPEEGKYKNGLKFTGYDVLYIDKEKFRFDGTESFSFSFWLKSHHEDDYMPVIFNLGGKNESYPGFEISIIKGYPTIQLVHTLPANLISVRAPKEIERDTWQHFTFTYDGSGHASHISIYVNGLQVKPVIVFDQLKGSTLSRGGRGLSVGGRQDYQTSARGYGILDDLKIYNRKLSRIESRMIYDNTLVADKPIGKDEIQEYHVLRGSAYQKINDKLTLLRKEKNNILDTLTGVMVMEDMPTPRETFILVRGAYDAPDKPVTPGTPAAILSFDETFPKSRKGLASWLVDRRNPLTARVAVNRMWQHFFGNGIVKTAEDFGSQGALPTHPALLDWLAADFMESGWDVKRMMKKIAMSATYRQSSGATPQQLSEDPENSLLGRGPRHRLQAEIIRDCALSASGLLVGKIGGKSVKPYQPKGLWSEKNQFSEKLTFYVQDEGEDLYRRSLYTFWRRTSPPPSMSVFDAPTRDNCTVRRQETNTPMQALVMLNDPQFVEASRKLAERVMLLGKEKEKQITLAYRLLTSITPEAETIRLLIDLQKEQLEYFQKNTELAREFLTVGNSITDSSLDKAELASMSIVCSAILSFDETIMKR